MGASGAVERAFELEAAAEAALAAGERDAAVDAIGEAVGLFFEHKHAGIARAIALEAEILVAAEHPTTPFSALGELPEEVVEAIAFASLERARRAEVKIARGVLYALRTLLMQRLGESHPATVRVLAGIANTERELGNHAGRIEALNALIASFDCIGAMPQVVEALLQRGLAEVELAEGAAALATHEESVALAAELALPEVSVRSLRFLALIRLDRGETKEAESVLARALAEAKRAKQIEQIGHLEATLAVVHAAAGDLHAAKQALDRATNALSEDDRELTWARERLDASDRIADELIAAHRRALI